jgi:hypothetical protein
VVSFFKIFVNSKNYKSVPAKIAWFLLFSLQKQWLVLIVNAQQPSFESCLETVAYVLAAVASTRTYSMSGTS